jgi:aminotransferase
MNSREVSRKVLDVQPSAIHRMSALAAKTPGAVALTWARPDADTPAHIGEAAVRAIREGVASRYSPPPGLPALREAVAKKLAAYNRIPATPAEILVTTGAVEGLFAAVLALLDPGDEVLMPSPNYMTHELMTRMASAVPVYFPTVEEEGWRLDLDALQRSITRKTKLIMFCNPCNPTGAVFPEADLRRLAGLAQEHDLYVLVDEAYEYFLFDGAEHFCIGSIPEMKGRVVESFTFTKTYAMTGWRIGYSVAAEELIGHMLKAHTPMTICAPVASQYAALEALEGPQECVAEFRRHYLEWRDLMCSRLDRLAGVFSYQKPLGSYTMFPRIDAEGGGDSAEFCMRVLSEAKVAMTPGSPFGPQGEGHARLCFCSSAGTINQAFDRLDAYFGG